MITKSQIMPMLLEACPAFRPAWERHRKYWGHEEAGIFNDVAEFAHFVVDAFARGETASFPEIFGTIGKFLKDGNEEVQAAASIGFLEDVRNIGSHRPFGNEVFIAWLGPNSMRAWKEIKEMWRGKHSLADVIRAERRAVQNQIKWHEVSRKRPLN